MRNFVALTIVNNDEPVVLRAGLRVRVLHADLAVRRPASVRDPGVVVPAQRQGETVGYCKAKHL